jgi:glycerophosphoryl diester phosphodiesterase
MNRAIFERPMLFAHRGASDRHVENTLTAFEACLGTKVDGVELDVQRCATGQLVVFHDFTLHRMAQIDRKISECSWEELKAITLADGERIPLLEEVFALLGDRLIYDIELKEQGVRSDGLERATLEAIYSHDLASRVVVSSFNPFSLLRFSRLCSRRLPTALIYSHTDQLPRPLRRGQGRLFARPSFLKPECAQVQRALQLSYQVVSWTVDDEATATDLLSMGVAGIISNRALALTHLFTG